jgi:hypothetical protein
MYVCMGRLAVDNAGWIFAGEMAHPSQRLHFTQLVEGNVRRTCQRSYCAHVTCRPNVYELNGCVVI